MNGPNKCGVLSGGFTAGFLLFASGVLQPALAAERSAINLGTTSFFDGFAAVAPGCTVITYTGYNNFKSLTGPDGSKIANAHLDAG